MNSFQQFSSDSSFGVAIRAGLPIGAGIPIPRFPAGLPRWDGELSGGGSRRSGFTLVEMLVVLTVFAFLLASVSLAIGTLFRAQSELRDELAQANIAQRLAAQLRADAHLSTSAEVVDEGDTKNLRLRLPNASINYAARPRRIIRTVTQGETETHREIFSLLEGTTTRWGLSSETPSFITLSISYRSPELRESVARPREHRVEASIGLHSGALK